MRVMFADAYANIRAAADDDYTLINILPARRSVRARRARATCALCVQRGVMLCQLF